MASTEATKYEIKNGAHLTTSSPIVGVKKNIFVIYFLKGGTAIINYVTIGLASFQEVGSALFKQLNIDGLKGKGFVLLFVF